MARVFTMALAFVLAAGGTSVAQTISLSPSVIQLRAAAGQSTTQRLTIENGTPLPQSFALVAEDVVVRGGAREFVPPGETLGSIAATAVFSLPGVVVPPGGRR